MSEGRIPTVDTAARNQELEDDDDLYPIIEPNDILDLPRVGSNDSPIEL